MKKLGLALSGGFAKGLAHIGVLKVLEKNKIPIYCIAGTSMGSVIGACYAAGLKAGELESLVKNTEFEDLVDFTFPGKGLVNGKKIENFISKILSNKTFKDLKKPFAAVATNLLTGKRKIFNSGSVAKAVRASISFPVVFTPIKIGKSVYVDGGLVDPVPVDAVEKMGCSIIIASDVSSTDMKPPKRETKPRRKEEGFLSEIKDTFIEMELDSFKNYIKERKMKLPFLFKLFLKPSRIKKYLENKKFKAPDILKIMMDSLYIMSHELRRLSMENKKINVMIRPNVKSVPMVGFDKIASLIKEGERATKKVLPKIKKLLK